MQTLNFTLQPLLQNTPTLHETPVPFDDLRVTPDHVVLAMGYEPGACPEPMPELIAAALDDAPRRVSPRGGLLVVPPEEVEVGEMTLRLRGVQFDTGGLIAGLLDTASACAVFAATAGPGLDAWSREHLAEGDPLAAFVVDALGTVVAERAIDWLEDLLVDAADDLGWSVTSQYGPGYCGWDVREQHKLFSLLPPSFCGITLTESALMQPVKSVSGVIGLGPDAQRKPHGCAVCTLETCFRRRTA